MMVDDLYDSHLVYIVTEGMVLCNIMTKKLCDALVALLATYYLFNVEQNIGRNVYGFLDMALMGIIPEKCPPSVKTLIGVLSNV
jgi:hypothetical protein